jgi:hypothetical protein
VQAKNAQIVLSKGGSPANTAWGGSASVSFVSEIFTKSNTRNDAFAGTLYYPISERNTANPSSSWGLPRRVLVSNVANDVAMTVLPDAPIDPATGLPVPTIAVATDGGLSIVKDDGIVANLAASTGAAGYEVYFVDFDSRGNLIASHSYDVNYGISAIWGFKADDIREIENRPADGGNGNINWGYPTRGVCIPFVPGDKESTADWVVSGLSLHGNGSADFSDGSLLSRCKLDFNDNTDGLVSYTTSAYATGWMSGDIKGAFLSDADDTDLVGSGELLDATTATDTSNGSSSIATPDAETVDFTVVGEDIAEAVVSIATTVGRSYTITTNETAGAVTLRIGTTSGGSQIFAGSINGAEHRTFVASSNPTYLKLSSSADGSQVTDLSVKLADADRSVNNNGLIVNGTITRSPVADGAELVGYSGFSAANYLEQPYNSDLDFGTGDFCVMGWVKEESGTLKYIFDRAKSDGTERYSFRVNNTLDFSGVVSGSVVVGNGTGWHFVAAVRRSGVLYLYVDGEADGSGANTANYTSASATLKVGTRYDNIQSIDALALIRISATAPTADQILKIYNDEKVLFQDNAQATLYGASDAVTALAYDEDTDLLHVGTSAGRSIFDGLRRVGNTTTSVSTAISATGGLVVEK